MNSALITLDLHGRNRYQAKVAIDSALRKSAGVYRIRVIHGFNSGTELRDFIREEYAGHKKLLRIDSSESGATTLILREL